MAQKFPIALQDKLHVIGPQFLIKLTHFIYLEVYKQPMREARPVVAEQLS